MVSVLEIDYEVHSLIAFIIKISHSSAELISIIATGTNDGKTENDFIPESNRA